MVGVENSFTAECSESGLPRCAPASNPSCLGVGQSETFVRRFIPPCAAWPGPVDSLVVGVGHKPNPVSPVRGVEGTSRYNNRPAGVAERFQVSQHTVEPQSDVSSNILKEAIPGP